MLQCPYCRAPLTETTAACPKCSLDFNRLKAVMGPVPLLSSKGITDLARTLKPNEDNPLRRALDEFHLRFPQSRAAILFQRFNPDIPLAAHLFWLFNSAPVSGLQNTRADNRDVLIGIDLQRKAAGLMIGYGLEPFLPQQALDHIMVLARPNLEAGRYAGGALDILDGLSRLMAGVCRDLKEVVGVSTDFATESKEGEY